jgi:hypothetical protein
MPERRYIAEQPAEEPGVHFWDVRWDECRWPLTAVSPISSFRFCGGKVVRRCWCATHAAQALRPTSPRKRGEVEEAPCGESTTPASPALPSAAPPAAIEQAPVTACRCRDRCILALQRWGVDSDEARDIVARIFAPLRPSERVTTWLAIESRFQEIARRRLGTHGAARGRPGQTQ